MASEDAVIDDFQSQANQPFVKRQAEAITRALLLKDASAPLTFDNVTGVLAEAEQKADFVCGFVALDVDVHYKALLKEHMVREKFISVDADGWVSLGSAGGPLAQVPLPPEIESNI